MDTTTLTVLLTCCGHNKLASVVSVREPVPVRRKEFVGKSTFLTQLTSLQLLRQEQKIEGLISESSRQSGELRILLKTSPPDKKSDLLQE